MGRWKKLDWFPFSFLPHINVFKKVMWILEWSRQSVVCRLPPFNWCLQSAVCSNFELFFAVYRTKFQNFQIDGFASFPETWSSKLDLNWTSVENGDFYSQKCFGDRQLVYDLIGNEYVLSNEYQISLTGKPRKVKIAILRSLNYFKFHS